MGGVSDKLVGGSAQGGMSRGASVLGAVDVALQVLDTNTHGKGFALEGKAALGQQGKDITGRVAARQDELRGRDGLFMLVAICVHVVYGDGRDGARCGARDIDHLGIEAHFAPEGLDLGDDIGDDGGQNIGADVRLGVPKDLARGSGFHKSLQDETMQRIFGSRRELAVGERSGTAQAKLDVAALIELTRAVEVLDVARSTRGIGAALDKERLEAGMGQGEGSEKARAACAYDDGPRDGAMTDRIGLREVRLVIIDEMDVLARGCIERFDAGELLGVIA